MQQLASHLSKCLFIKIHIYSLLYKIIFCWYYVSYARRLSLNLNLGLSERMFRTYRFISLLVLFKYSLFCGYVYLRP